VYLENDSQKGSKIFNNNMSYKVINMKF